MASGRDHDRATLLASLPFGLALLPLLGSRAALLGALAFLIGGLWLSPDLDTRSRPSQRWRWLSGLWWPYRRLVRHRGWLSHTPLLGSASRLLLLLGWLLLALVGLQTIGGPGPNWALQQLQQLWQSHPRLLITALLAIEASAWLHLLQDGDPMPRPLRR